MYYYNAYGFLTKEYEINGNFYSLFTVIHTNREDLILKDMSYYNDTIINSFIVRKSPRGYLLKSNSRLFDKDELFNNNRFVRASKQVLDYTLDRIILDTDDEYEDFYNFLEESFEETQYIIEQEVFHNDPNHNLLHGLNNTSKTDIYNLHNRIVKDSSGLNTIRFRKERLQEQIALLKEGGI